MMAWYASVSMMEIYHNHSMDIGQICLGDQSYRVYLTYCQL
jgi:hypothetical protein